MPTQLTTGREVSQYETTDNAHRHDATCMPPGFQNDCNSRPVNDIEKARLAREYHSSTDYNSEMQVLWAIFCLVSIRQKKSHHVGCYFLSWCRRVLRKEHRRVVKGKWPQCLCCQKPDLWLLLKQMSQLLGQEPHHTCGLQLGSLFQSLRELAMLITQLFMPQQTLLSQILQVFRAPLATNAGFPSWQIRNLVVMLLLRCLVFWWLLWLLYWHSYYFVSRVAYPLGVLMQLPTTALV